MLRAFIVLIFISPHLFAREYLDLSPNLQQAYLDILSYDLPSAQTALQAERSKYPENMLPLMLDSYSDLMQYYLTKNEAALISLQQKTEKRVTTVRDKTSGYSAWYLHAQAVMWFHHALSQWIGQHYLQGVLSLRKAYLLSEENREKFQQFEPSKVLSGAIIALLGATPTKYQWGLGFLGLKGDIHKGIGLINEVADKGMIKPAIREARFLSVALSAYLLSPSAGINKLYEYKMPLEHDLTSLYLGVIVGLMAKANDDVFHFFTSIDPVSFITCPELLFWKGVTTQQQLKPESENYFTAYLEQGSTPFYRKAAQLRLAWHAALKGDTIRYNSLLLQIKNQPGEKTEADRNAIKEMENEKFPIKNLLMSRLLFDGGYYSEAEKALLTFTPDTDHELEYYYRMARIKDEMAKKEKAKQLYKKVIRLDDNNLTHFSTNAALQLGLIFEQEGRKDSSRLYFSKCISLKGYGYENSLHAKAEAGLKRVGE